MIGCALNMPKVSWHVINETKNDANQEQELQKLKYQSSNSESVESEEAGQVDKTVKV